jgi:hypothetical protein
VPIAVKDSSDTKVTKSRVTIRADEYILRLDVAVHESAFMAERNSCT